MNSQLIETYNKVHASKFEYPLLMIECGQDKIVCNKAIREFFQNCKSTNKTFQSFEDVGHDAHHDNDYWPVMVKDIVAWQNTNA